MIFVVSVFSLIITAGKGMASEEVVENSTFAAVAVQGDRIEWHPHIQDGKLTLTVTGLQNAYYHREFRVGSVPYFRGVGDEGNRFPDGACTYQLKRTQASGSKHREDGLPAGRSTADQPLIEEAAKPIMVQSGTFLIEQGRIISEEATIEMEASLEKVIPRSFGNPDHCIYDDVIITGSECVGFDCADGEDFGFCTQIYKEHNLQVCFKDTSYTASYPTNDWKIQINDSTNGGASYFTIWDEDGGVRPFTIEAGAPSHSLYVEDYGRVGLGTSTPVVELHIKDSDTPTVRLEQDSSGGWTAQTWDVAGNESNFFVRDATNGSKLPFRIQPSTPSSTLCLKANGYVGVGTWSPEANLHIEAPNTDTGPLFLVERLGGDKQYFTVKDSGDVELMKTIGEGSDRNLKKNIRSVDTAAALAGVVNMPVSTWSYKVDDDHVVHMGPMAQDFNAAFGLGKDDKHIASLDASGVSFAAIQELFKRIQNQHDMILKQNETIQTLHKRIAQLESRVN